MALKKEKKEKENGKQEKRHWPFKFPGIDFNQRGKTCNNGRRCNQQWPSASSYLWNQKQQSVIRASVFGEQGPFCPPWHPQALCNCSRNMYTDARHVAEGWGMGSKELKSLKELKLTEINHNVSSKTFPLNCKTSMAPQFQSIYIRSLCQWNIFLGGDSDCWYFLLHLPRILWLTVFDTRIVFF